MECDFVRAFGGILSYCLLVTCVCVFSSVTKKACVTHTHKALWFGVNKTVNLSGTAEGKRSVLAIKQRYYYCIKYTNTLANLLEWLKTL